MTITAKRFLMGALLGALAVCGAQLLVGLTGLKLGLLNVSADATPPEWEKQLAGIAVHASVARHAAPQTNPVPLTKESLDAGARIYQEVCARCHGKPGAGPSIYGSSFYPPAPYLAGRPIRYTDAELFQIVKFGIRNTAMPAWKSSLSDQDIWQVVTVLRRFDHVSD